MVARAAPEEVDAVDDVDVPEAVSVVVAGSPSLLVSTTAVAVYSLVSLKFRSKATREYLPLP